MEFTKNNKSDSINAMMNINNNLNNPKFNSNLRFNENNNIHYNYSKFNSTTNNKQD